MSIPNPGIQPIHTSCKINSPMFSQQTYNPAPHENNPLDLDHCNRTSPIFYLDLKCSTMEPGKLACQLSDICCPSNHISFSRLGCVVSVSSRTDIRYLILLYGNYLGIFLRSETLYRLGLLVSPSNSRNIKISRNKPYLDMNRALYFHEPSIECSPPRVKK